MSTNINILKVFVKTAKLPDLLLYLDHFDDNIRSIINWRLNTGDRFIKNKESI
jgi:hypothetical protein